MCSLNVEGKACGGHEVHVGSAHFPKVFDGTFNAPVDVTPIYIGVGLQVFPFFTTFQNSYLIAGSFPSCLYKPCFLGLIGGPSRNFNFLVSFSNFVCIA